MSELLDLVLRAHGGLDRWSKFNKIGATIVSGGGLLPMKGIELPQPPAGTATVATTHEQSAVISPFGQSDWHMVFRPERVAVETTAGAVVDERANPRAAFDGHTLNTPWDLLHRTYFNGYARWTYLTTPFFMVLLGFQVAEIEAWQEGAESWRGLRVRFPDEIASHSREQEFYFGEDFLR
jgi:hypothetical protein